jgi:hypothetical protein
MVVVVSINAFGLVYGILAHFIGHDGRNTNGSFRTV